jgi:hypothetical protein
MFGGADFSRWNGDGRFDVNLSMGHCTELNQAGLRTIRSWANLDGFGCIQYRMVGAVLRTTEARIRPPKYTWYFVRDNKSEASDAAPTFTLPNFLKEALLEVESTNGSVHLEHWGLFRSTKQGIELLPDPGPLADDHPHAGWVPVPLSTIAHSNVFQSGRQSQAIKLPTVSKSGGLGRVSSRFMVSIVAGMVWIGLLGAFRLMLVGDGVEPSTSTRWAKEQWVKAGLLVEWIEPRAFYTPAFLNSAGVLRDEKPRSETINSPLEIGEDPSAEQMSPTHFIVLGLYSSPDLAEHWRKVYQFQGFDAIIFERRVSGKGLLFTVALPYHGIQPLHYLKTIRRSLIPEAWLLDAKDFRGWSTPLSSEGLPS